jgi:hypothetical protein
MLDKRDFRTTSPQALQVAVAEVTPLVRQGR